MELSSDAPFSQTITLTVQVEPATTPTIIEVPPLPPKGKGKVSEKIGNCSNNRKKFTTWDHFEKI